MLRIVRAPGLLAATDDAHPFVAFDSELAWAGCASAHGMTASARAALVYELDDAVRDVGGVGFAVTPFARQDAMSDALGFDPDGGVWVKDETCNVGGSHKARHLFTVLLHLRACETLGLAPWVTPSERPPLAIASCGNAAIAAATLAAALRWPLTVFIPPWASQSVVATLRAYGATLQVCQRLVTDAPGDPCIYRFREAVAGGAVPFSVQGPENALCLDGGRVMGFEMLSAGFELDRVFVQVGGGALAAGLADALAIFRSGARLHAVQAQGCAPLDRAWSRAVALPGGAATAAEHWDDCMWPWEHEPASIADGILDDETYDWIEVVEGMFRSGGSPVVATEADLTTAHEIGVRRTAIDVSATGTAGLAGLIAMRERVADSDRVAVVFSGAER